MTVWRTVAFTDRIDLAFAAADVAISRAGASTIAELAVCGVPAVLVPLPGSLDEDQRKNAQAVVQAGGGVIVLDADLEKGLYPVLEDLLSDEVRLAEMEKSMRTLARPRAAADLAALVLGAASPKRL